MQDNFSDDKRPDQSPGVSNDEEFGRTDTYWKGRRRRNRSQSSRLFFAAFLMIAGTLLFLGNLGLFPVRDIWDYWPLWLVVVGVGKLLSARHAAGQALGALLVVFGALFLTVTLGIFHINARDDSWPLSLLLIAFGAIALIKTLEAGRGAKPAVGFSSQPPVSADNLIHDTAIFGAIKRKIEAANFQGGDVNAIFGSVDLNLRRAQMPLTDGSVTLDVNALFGSVKIRVPENWTINIKGAAILGSYEDKTIPPASTAAGAPVLTITGYSVFGSVEIED